MTDLALTNHAITRMAQRAILPSDLDIILTFGSEVDDGILVRHKDVENVERAIRELLKRIQKMKGKRIVVSEGQIITAYHASGRRLNRLTRSRH